MLGHSALSELPLSTTANAASIAATVSVTLGDVTASSTATLAISASLSSTLGAMTVAGTAKVAIAASESTTLGAVTVASSATLAIAATLGKTLDDVTLASTATVSAAAINATASITLDAVTVTSIGESARDIDRGGDGGFPGSSSSRNRRKAKSAERLKALLKASKPLVYLKHLATEVDEPAPELVARRITKAVIADAVSQTPFWAQWTNATAAEALPSEIFVPPESGISPHDIALAIAGYLRGIAEQQAIADDEDEIEMLLLTA